MTKPELKISLFRHGPPNIKKLKRITSFEFTHWITDYDAAHLITNAEPTLESQENALKCQLLMCSDLPRAIDSAKILQSTQTHKNIQQDKLFIEAGLPSGNGKRLKLSSKLWAILFRIAWRFGYTQQGKTESYVQAQNRAQLAASCLIIQAQKTGHVGLVGHGIFNRLIAKQLLKRQWENIKPIGTDYWSYGIFKSPS